MTAAQSSCIINWANFTAAGIGAILLGYFGRKTLFVYAQGACIFGMFGMWIFSQLSPNDTMKLLFSVFFIFAFEFGPGPIAWLYLSEVCNDQATSVNTVVNWGWTLVVSLGTLPLINAIDGWIYLGFGCTCILGFAYLITMMKETKGLSKEECKRLYLKSANAGGYDQLVR